MMEVCDVEEQGSGRDGRSSFDLACLALLQVPMCNRSVYIFHQDGEATQNLTLAWITLSIKSLTESQPRYPRFHNDVSNLQH